MVGLVLLPPGSWTSCSYLSRQLVGKAARVRHMAAGAGQHVVWRMVTGSSGQRRAQGGRAAAGSASLRRLGLFSCLRRASGFYCLGGGGAADQLESGTERGRRRRRGLQLDGVGLAARDAPLPSCNLHTAGVLTGLIPSSWRTPAWGGRSGRELTRRREAHTQFSRGKKKKPPSAASKSRKPTQRCQEDWC